MAQYRGTISNPKINLAQAQAAQAADGSAESKGEKQIAVDGFMQVVEMLQAADPAFRKSLLERITQRDPALARSLLKHF